MLMTDEFIYILVHKKGNSYKYIKTTEEFIIRIFDSVSEAGFTVERRNAELWEDNMKTGLGYEAVTERQTTNTIASITGI